MLFITTLILSILTGAELDLFTPSFPELQKVFELSPFMTEWLLSINLICHCVGTFIAGTLGDNYGKKNIINLGLVIFILGTISCLFAKNYVWLVLGRGLQGLGISSPAVLSFLLIADNYSLSKQQHLMGLLNGLGTIAMAAAPVFGSYISLTFKWQGNFTVLLIFGIICLILTQVTIAADKITSKSRQILQFNFNWKKYKQILTNHNIMSYTIVIWLLSQSYWIFIGMSPILYINSLNVTLKEFGLYQGALCICFAISSLLSSYCLKRFGIKKCWYFGIAMLMIFAIATLLILLTNNQNPLLLTLALQLEGIGVVFPINILWPLALQQMPKDKAKIASIMVGGRLIITASSLQIVSYFYQDRFLEIGIAMLISLVIALFILAKLANMLPTYGSFSTEELASF